MKLVSTTKYALLMPLVLAGCDSLVPGSVHVISSFQIEDKNGVSFELAPGPHDMDVSYKTNVIKFRVKDNRDNIHNVRIKIASEKENSPATGEFHLKAADIKQAFDLVGTIKTEEQDSDAIETYIDCGYKHFYTFEAIGKRRIVSHVHTIDHQVKADFLMPNSDDSLGQFNGSQLSEKLVYDYFGPCPDISSQQE
jgi:hypothetical protein